jgi:hypothetical protein
MAAIQEKDKGIDGLHQKDQHELATPATNFASSAEKHFDLEDPGDQRLFELYRPEYVTPEIRGIEVMQTPELNKVCRV